MGKTFFTNVQSKLLAECEALLTVVNIFWLFKTITDHLKIWVLDGGDKLTNFECLGFCSMPVRDWEDECERVRTASLKIWKQYENILSERSSVGINDNGKQFLHCSINEGGEHKLTFLADKLHCKNCCLVTNQVLLILYYD